MDPLTRAWLKVVIDGQAYLHAQHMLTLHHLTGQTTEAQVQNWENDWKKESAKLVQELLDDEGGDE